MTVDAWTRPIAIAAALLYAAGAAAQLDERCVVSVMNRTAQVQADGSWVIENVPATMGPVRARAVCVQNGITRVGSSDFITLPPGESINSIAITFEAVPAIPVSLTLTATETALAAAGATTQLTTAAAMTNGASVDVSRASSGTVYRSTNPAVATVSPDGLVTARASGNVIVTASHEGTLALLRITVASVVDTDGDGMPDDYETALGFDPFDPADGGRDNDSDGLTNVQEFLRGTDPLRWDTDGDSVSDGVEVQTGTDPLDPSSYDLSTILRSLEFRPRPTVDLLFEPLIGSAARQFSVTGIMNDGNGVDITTGRGTTYSTADPAVAAVTAPGRLEGLSAGTTTLTATNSGISASEPVNVSSFTPANIASLTLSGTPRAIAAGDKYVFVATTPSQVVTMISVHTPNQPAVTSSVFINGYTGGTMAVDRNRLFVADSTGVTVVDISVPTNARVLSHINVSGGVRDISIVNFSLALATPTALLVTSQSGTVFASIPIANARSVDSTPAGNVVVLDGASVLHAIDFTGGISSAAPRKSAQLAGGSVVRAWGDFAYVNSPAGLTTVDFSPAVPRVVSTLAMPGAINQLTVRSGFAFAALSASGTAVVDVGDAMTPVQKLLLQLGTAPVVAVAATQRHFFDLQLVGGNTQVGIYQYFGGQETTSSGFFPEVRIASPADGSTVLEGALVPVSIEATDDYLVDFVSLLAGERLHTSSKRRPAVIRYRVPVGATEVTLRAEATDFALRKGTSGTITLAVARDTAPPTVRLTAPTDPGAVRGQQLQVAADANDDAAVLSVEFFVNGVSLGKVTSAPYSVTYTVPAAGNDTMTFTAIAIDGVGTSTTSDPFVVTVLPNQPPTISILPPNTLGRYAGGDILITADARDDVGINAVRFLVNGVYAYATAFNPPYERWLQLPPGQTSVRVSAVAYDGDGHETASDEITVHVAPTSGLSLIPVGGSQPYELVMQGQYGYIAGRPSSLTVVDVANSAAPVLVATLALPGDEAVALKVSGRYAFVVTQTAGIQIVDVADPHDPQVVATAILDVQPTAIWLDGEHAFVSTRGGVQILDIRNPLAPQRGPFIPAPRWVRQTLVSGTTLYVVHDYPLRQGFECEECSVVRAYDISNLSVPRELGQVTSTSGPYHHEPIRLELDGNRLYVGGNEFLGILDVTNPAAMRELGTFDRGPMGYCCYHDAKFLDGKLFVAGFDWSGVGIVDTGDPAEMTLLGQVVLKEGDRNRFVGYSVVATPELVFSAGEVNRVMHFGAGRHATVSDTAGLAPQVTIARPLAGATVFEGQVAAIDVDATDDAGVASVQISVDGQPVATLRAAPFTFLWNVPAGATQHTVTATATDYAGNTGSAVPVAFNVVADVTAPTVRITSPAAGGSVPSTAMRLRAAASDDFSVVSVTFSVDGVEVGTVTAPPYEIEYNAPAGTTSVTVTATAMDQAGNSASSDPVQVTIYVPRITGSVALAGSSQKVVVSGNRAYVAAAPGGLQIVDISNPALPRLLGTAAVGSAYDVKVSGKYAYVTGGSGGLVRIVDISSPASPVVVGTVGATGASLGLVGTRLYVGGSVLTGYDVAEPATPRFLAQGTTRINRSSMRAVHGADGRYALAVSFLNFGGGGLVEAYDTTQPLTFTPASFQETNALGHGAFGQTFFDISIDGSFVAVAKADGLALTSFTNGGFVGQTRVQSSSGYVSIAQHGGWLAAGRYDAGNAVLFDVTSRVSAVPRYTFDISPIAPSYWQKAIAVTPTHVVMATTKNDNTASRLVIASYRTFSDALGVAPAVSVTAPATAAPGKQIHLVATAVDDVGIASVTFTVNGVDIQTDTTAPYEVNYLVPQGTPSLTVGARAQDFGGNTGVASEVSVPVP